MKPTELQETIVSFLEEHGVEMTIKVLCNMLSIVAETTGSFEVENDRNGVTITIDAPE
jgi:hypothetical protein